MRITIVRGVAFALSLLAGSAVAETADASPYPKTVEFEDGYVVIHAPQVHEWPEFTTLQATAALEGHMEGRDDIVYANAAFTASAVPDIDRRVVTVSDVTIEQITIADGTLVDPARQRMLQDALPSASRELPLDLVLSHISGELFARDDAGLNTAPPTIHVASEPTIIVILQGEAVVVPVPDAEAYHVVNTNWTLFTNEKQSKWWLLNDREWLYSKALDGKWKYPRRLPSELKELPFNTDWNTERSAANSWKKPKDKNEPVVITSTTPAELIVTDGPPALAEVVDGLSYVTNSTSHLFQTGDTWYFLVSGRWFSTDALEGGTWQAVETLPAVFADIPDDHAKAEVRASVPGTLEARMAALEAVLPRKTDVPVDQSPDIEVAYAGEPRFEDIPETDAARAVNTGYDVLRVGETYYLCYSGAWYTSSSATGPWLPAAEVPATVYDIPPSSPVYHTTHVEIADTSSTHVTFGVTAGYYGTYVSYGVPVWGTGWYYPPYVYYDPFYPGYPYYPYYYPYPYSYGSASFYNPNTGAFGSTSRWYGPYGGAGYTSAYNPSTGTYASVSSAWDNDEYAAYGQAYNPRTGRAFETERYYDADENRWTTDSTLSGDRGSVDINRRWDDDSGRATFETSRGGSGEFNRTLQDGGWNTNTEFETGGGRTITGEGRYENGEGSSSLTGSEGGTGTITREVDEDGVTRTGSYERGDQSVDITTERDGSGDGPKRTIETGDGGQAVVQGRGDDRSFVGQSGSGDLYAGRDGNVYRRTDDGWYHRDDGEWNQIERPGGGNSSGSAQPRRFDEELRNSRAQTYGSGSAGSRTGYDRSGLNRSYDRSRTGQLNRDYRARSYGMSQYRSRASDYRVVHEPVE